MKQLNNKYFLPTLGIVSLLSVSLLIRFWRVTEAPATVNWDEAAVGYNANSLLHTGRDEFGKAFPVALRSFDDYKPALYSYLSVVPIALLGLGELSTRLTSILAGTILIFSVLYITAKLSGNFKLGLIAGIFTAVSPWAIHFSRIAFEANLAVAIYFVAIAIFIKKPGWSLAFFVLSMYAYHAQRAIAIPTWLALVWVFNKRIDIKSVFPPATLLIPLGISFLTEPAGSRLTSTMIFKLWPFVPADFPRLIFSPIYALTWQGVGQFLAYFSPISLFVRGSNEPILRIPTLGLLSLELLPLWVGGLVSVFRNTKINKLLWVVLALAPLPGVITWNWFSVVRTLAVYPAFAIVAALGGLRLLKLPRLLRLGFWGIFALSSLYTVLTIGIFAPYETYGDFQPGFEQSVPYLLSEAKKYDKVIVDSPHIAPYIFVLFYGKYPPAQYLVEAGLNRKNSGTEDYAFGKFEFRKITAGDLQKQHVLLMGPTPRIPDYVVDEWRKNKITVAEFLDPMGYISFRVASL
jgi:4-amino-4-deoxy-L-arabinose transferase-like glycosyltransferase